MCRLVQHLFQCQVDITRVKWKPTKPEEVEWYRGVMKALIHRGTSVRDHPRYEEYRQHNPCYRKARDDEHDRVLVEVDHDRTWHIQRVNDKPPLYFE